MDPDMCGVKVKQVPSPGGYRVPLPEYATEGAAALDLRACIDHPVVLEPGCRAAVPAGLAIEMPGPWLVGLVFPRSGLGIIHGVVLSNGVGVIDSDYRGQITCGILNQGADPYTVMPGDRIAQLSFIPVIRARLELVGELSETARGSGGLGSTGK